MNFEQLETETDATKGKSDVEIDSFTWGPTCKAWISSFVQENVVGNETSNTRIVEGADVEYS